MPKKRTYPAYMAKEAKWYVSNGVKWTVYIRRIEKNCYETGFIVGVQKFQIIQIMDDPHARVTCQYFRRMFLKALTRMGIKQTPVRKRTGGRWHHDPSCPYLEGSRPEDSDCNCGAAKLNRRRRL
jgi:hypothetical protein